MNDASHARPDPSRLAPTPPAASPALPLLAWLIPQLLAISLAAWRVPLATGYAGYPRPAESLAPDLLIAVQVGLAALLSPLVLRDVRTALMAAASAWPLTVLAGSLAALPAGRTALACAYVTGWVAALALWQRAMRSYRSQLLVVALASAVSIGGAALAYLRAEFAAPVSDEALASGAFGPLAAAIAIPRAPAPVAWPAWLWSIAPILVATAVLAAGAARQRPPRTNTPQPRPA